jgi:peptide/nickel transport system substrate-binding protein
MLVFLLCACNQQQNNVIRFGLSTAPVTLDPRYATDAVSHRINRLIYERLVDFDEHYHMIPVLADWQQLTTTHYRFQLTQGNRQFHNGDILTTDDVKATYTFILDEKNISPHRATLLNIDRIEILDKDTIDFHIKVPDPVFPGRLVIGILPKKLMQLDHPFNELPVGSGALKLIQWPDENHLLLQRLSDDQAIEFITVKDSTVRALKLLRGEIDIIQNDVPFELLAWLQEHDAIVIETIQGNVFTYLGFNLQDPDLKQLTVRKAIAHAINREEIIEYVLGGAARKAGALLPPDHWAGNPGLSGYPFDPEHSRMLLRKAGYNINNPLTISYKTSNNPLRLRLSTIIQYQLGQVDINIDLRSYDWGTLYGDIKSGRFQMYSLSWVGLNLPDIFRYVFHSSSTPPAGANRGHFEDVRTDELIELAESKTDLKEQAEIYHELQKWLHEKLPYIPLWYEDNLLARGKNITGYTLYPDGEYDGLITAKKSD